MELIGKVSIAAGRGAVWAALNDQQALRACIPGCEEVVDESPSVRRVRIMVKIGPVRARFTGRVTLSQVHEPDSCVLAFEGSGGAAGMASGKSSVTLADDAEGGTTLSYSVSAAVGGKLGQVGGRLIDSSAQQLANQFFSALRDRLTGAAAPATEAPAAAAPPDRDVAAAPGAVGGAVVRGEGSRLLWFLMGVLSTGVGVAIGAIVFGRAG